ncbi:MAG TPA: translation initiation factor IF-2 [Dehalococcoidia bacterium]|nr:translation initiation factor IF-2 [Dehalococcoidia bacterium]
MPYRPRTGGSRRRSGRRRTGPRLGTAPTGPTRGEGLLVIPRTLTVQQLAGLTKASSVEIIKELMKNGVMASINQVIDFDTASLVARDMGFEPQQETRPEEAAGRAAYEEEDPSLLEPRAAVVTIMGHVDHGKTKLLDAIRKTNVVAEEVGGITQHIGAYQVEVHGQRITFIDTPGHEAFTSMRARGAKATDIAVLVVAADDGVMPQTVEAIDHAKAAQVPIVVAVNKMDLPDANPERVKQQLSEHSLLIEEWGGDVICVPVSAKTQEGLPNLLEIILLLAEIQELKANPHRPAGGVVIEAELDSSRGPMATVLVQTGTLRVGDVVVAGETWGRVKAMFDEWGHRRKTAGPATPAKVMGLTAVPQGGDLLAVLKDEHLAREIVEARQREREAAALRPTQVVTLETFYGEVQAGKIRELNIVLKTDVQGTLDAARNALERLSEETVKVNIIHAATGTVIESDVLLALASKGIVVGFNTRPEPGARRLAEGEGVDIRYYEIIYELVDDVTKAVKGLLEPVYVEVVEGHAEVRQVFKVRSGKVAGCHVRDGQITRAASARLIRGEEVLHTSRVSSLRRFQEDVREVQAGYECGIGIEDFTDYQEGDVIETFGRQRKS